jgi:predicted O-methyltransferase YrrM
MTLLLELTDLFWLIVVAVLAMLLRRERARRKDYDLSGPWPIAAVMPHEIDPVFAPGPYGPTLETEVAYVGRGPYSVAGGTSDAEAWILAVLAMRAGRLFELGTCTGKTAYLWARNTPDESRVITLTLPPDGRTTYSTDSKDDRRSVTFALEESSFSEFLYSGTIAEPKVEQLFGDSKTFDFSPWAGTCDVVFVDGSHAYSYVVHDTQKALELVRPGGLVLWHDYAGPRHCPDVFRALNELAARIPLVRIKGTTIVAHRRPGYETTAPLH